MNVSPHAAFNDKTPTFQLPAPWRGVVEMCSTLSPPPAQDPKTTLLQETLNQIQHIKIGEDDLQKSEVSSSNLNPFIGSQLIAPFLLHALDGFCFVVNTEGKIEYMSPNVETFLKYDSENLLNNSIYNIIHVGDHARFSSNLLPMSIGNGLSWGGEGGDNPSFQCRFLVRPPSDAEETMEEKQTRVSLYEQMSVTTVLLPKAPTKGEEAQQEVLNRLICVARRIPAGEKSVGKTPQEFVTRLDARGKIISVDTATISSPGLSFLHSELVGRTLQEICHPEDLPKLQNHFKETLQQGSNTSGIYRLRFSNEKIIFVHTNSKRTSQPYNPMASEHEVIVASHTIVRDSSDQQQCMDSGGVAAPQRSNPSPAGGGSSLVPSLGGGTLNGGGGFSFPTLSPQDFNLNDLDFLPTSSWDLGTAPAAEAPPQDSPNRPGQQGGGSSRSNTPFGGAGFPFSPAPKQEQSNGEPPQLIGNRPGSSRSNTPFSGTGGFPFSPAPKPDAPPLSNGDPPQLSGGSPPLERIASAQQQQMSSVQQQKLRNLLTHGGPPEEADSSKQAENPAPVENGFGSNGGDQGTVANENLILRELLNQEDEEMDTGANKDKRNNNMLRKVSGGDLGGGPKRKSPDTPTEESMAKRPAPQPPAQPHAHLAGQNPMLASMLAQTPRTAPTVTTSLASAIVSQLPQERLPKNLEKKLVHTPYTGANPQGIAAPPTYSFASRQHQQEVVTADARGHVTLGNPAHFNQLNNNNFLGQFGQGASLQNTANILIDGLAEAARDPNNVVSASDPLLSDILDQVWSMEQDMNLATDDLAFFKLLEELPDPSAQRPPPVSQQVDAQEKLAIQSIQKQLMSCEPQRPVGQLYPQQPPFPQPPPSYTRPPQPQQRPPHYGGGQGFNELTPPMRRQLLEQHKHKVFLQQQYNQKKQQLLLQQQQQQQQKQLQNSMPGSPFGDSMSELLNNSVAPNVTLQRSASMPEPQLSPRYSAPSSPGQRGGPYSPMAAYPPFPPQGGQRQHPSQQQQQWTTQQQRANLQQQNPMLNAQLSQQQFAASNAQRFSSQQRQPLGGVNSPRNSPYPPDFHPSSPAGMFQQQPTPPANRMQRATSIPNRVNSPRGLGGSFDPLLSPQPSPGSYSSPPVSSYGSYGGGMDPNFPAYDHQQQSYPATMMDRSRGNGGGAIRSEYVRQELRAKVGARTQQHQQIHQQQQMVLPPGGSASQSISQADFDALGFSLDLGNDVAQPPSPALYSQSLMDPQQRTGSPRFQLEERPAEQKKSLLQQLLSEPP